MKSNILSYPWFDFALEAPYCCSRPYIDWDHVPKLCSSVHKPCPAYAEIKIHPDVKLVPPCSDSHLLKLTNAKPFSKIDWFPGLHYLKHSQDGVVGNELVDGHVAALLQQLLDWSVILLFGDYSKDFILKYLQYTALLLCEGT